MKLHPILRTDNNAFNACAPAAIAAITGMGTKAARDALRQGSREILNRANRRITYSVYTDETILALKMYGYNVEPIFKSTWNKQVKLSDALNIIKLSFSDTVYLCHVKRTRNTGHIITYDGAQIIDNFRPQGCSPFEHPYWNTIVVTIDKITLLSAGDL